MAVGYVYDPIYLEHDTGGDPENSARLAAIMEHLASTSLLTRLVSIPAERASLEDLTRIHSPALVERVRRMAERGGGLLEAETVVSARSYEAALFAAGGAMAATRAVLAGEVESAFALVRPPGHHATATQVMGFCLFNNVAIAAAWALASGGVSRLAIVDFDAHHGNGTAAAFEHDPRALFISLHQYPFYPGTGHWREKYVRVQTSAPPSLNIPLPAYTGDAGYRQAFERLVAPMLRAFRPELILVSAGYDAHWSDPLTWLLLSIDGYRTMADSLVRLARELCRGRLVCSLEGGYSPQALAHGVSATLSAMLDLGYDDPLGPAPVQERPVGELIETIARWHGL